jgi:tetratricopeptide (TPR) repeat protein
MARRLDEAQLQMTAVKDGQFNLEASLAAYADAFQWYGLNVERLDPREAGARIRSRSIRVQLAAALQHWALLRSREARRHGRKDGDVFGKHLLAVARAADPDKWRDQLRNALWRDREALEKLAAEALEKLAASEQTAEMPPLTLVLLGMALEDTGAGKQAALLLRQAQRRHPGHFWINHELAEVLGASKPPQWEDAIRFYTAALALRPKSPGVHLNLSKAFYHKRALDEAIAASQQAIALKPDYAEAYANLGGALVGKGAVDQAIAACQKAIRLKPDLFEAHGNLGVALREKGDLDGALASFKKALRLNRHFLVYINLGMTLAAKGDLDGAIAAFQEVNRLEPNESGAYLGLGNALAKKGDLDRAIDAFREAVRVQEDFAEAHCNLGWYLMRHKGEFAKALPALRRGHELGSKRPDWRYPSGEWVRQCERLLDLDGKLSAILRGERLPADAAERLEFAELCGLKQLYAAGARFYQEAFASKPELADDLQKGRRYNAACLAAQAGCGKGKDADQPTEEQRADLRRKALAWLRADLAAWRQQLEKDPDRARPAVRQQMQHWQRDGDLAGVRGTDALAKLPEAERRAWQEFWADVENTLAQTRGRAVPGASSRKD